MRVLIQRVQKAAVYINSMRNSFISNGLLVFVGIEEADTQEDIDWLCHKIVHLRIFNDQQGVMNLSALDTQADLLVVSQFTLHASTKKGNRPSYIQAARPDIAVPLYTAFCKTLELLLLKSIQCGVFGADMQVELINDGPITIWVDSKNKE